MRRNRYPLFVLAAAILALAVMPLGAEPSAPPTPAEPQVRHVILISWDGAGRDILGELLAKNKLPNLAALIKDGSLQNIDIGGHITETLPGHAQMLSSLGPKTTGIASNFDRKPMPQGYTLFERLQKAFGKEALATIAIIGKAKFGGTDPKAKSRSILSNCAADITVYSAADRDAAEVTDPALKALDQEKASRYFAFLHFRDPDVWGHEKGSGSAEYREGFIKCDQALGQIVELLKTEKLYDSTLLYVTADHGFDKNSTDHLNAPHIWLATNDKTIVRGGTQADIPATILARLGLDLATLEPRLIGQPLTKAAEKPAAAAMTKPAAARAPAKPAAAPVPAGVAR
jgi:predicted AlkP superfamily pyrophosphatase or phosphodiesterase